MIFLGICYEDWKIINTFVPWFSAFSTISVAILSLHLASLNREISLSMTSNISISNNGSDDRIVVQGIR